MMPIVPVAKNSAGAGYGGLPSTERTRDENGDVQGTRGNVRPEVVGWNMGRDGQNLTNHVLERHPDVAKKMERMHNEDPEKWGREMKPKWQAAREQ